MGAGSGGLLLRREIGEHHGHSITSYPLLSAVRSCRTLSHSLDSKLLASGCVVSSLLLLQCASVSAGN
jgi:hypothetical protein